MADPKMLGGRCREGGAENNRSEKRNFCLAEHFSFLPVELLRPNPKLVGGGWATLHETANRLRYSHASNQVDVRERRDLRRFDFQVLIKASYR